MVDWQGTVGTSEFRGKRLGIGLLKGNDSRRKETRSSMGCRRNHVSFVRMTGEKRESRNKAVEDEAGHGCTEV